MKVGFTFNIKSEVTLSEGHPCDLTAEFDRNETIDAIEAALAQGGHQVIRIGNVHQLLERLPNLDVDIVFNIAEGFAGRNRESQVPILLELYKIPYVGSDALALGLTLDKVLAKKVLKADGIPTPHYVLVDAAFQHESVDLRFPLIVKLRCEGSSKGLTENSLAENATALRKQIEYLRQHYPGSDIFVEEFIEGQEFTVALIGNAAAVEAFPVVQTSLDGVTDLGKKFYTFAHLGPRAQYLCPASIASGLATLLQDLAKRTFQALDCRDFGRVDFRVDRNGWPYVLEINPLPSLSIQDVFSFVGQPHGLTYADLVNRVLDTAVARYPMRQTSISHSP